MVLKELLQKPISSKTLAGAAVGVMLSVISVFATYLFLEFVLFRLFMPFIPLRSHPYLHEGIQIYAQSSKRFGIPRAGSFVLIVGDSYARGNGDWLWTTSEWGNGPFQAAHVMHDMTGLDFVNFGRSGAGSFEAYAVQPALNKRFLDKTWLYKLPKPEKILAYFYEGNDLNNNLEEPRIYCSKRKRCNEERVYDPSYAHFLLEKVALPHHELYTKTGNFKWTDNLFFADFVDSLMKKHFKELEFLRFQETELKTTKSVNKVLVNGKVTVLYDDLQSPALDLTEEEMKTAFNVFSYSLGILKETFPDSEIVVVYIPSTLSSYTLKTDYVDIHSYSGRKSRYPAGMVYERSDYIASEIKKRAVRLGAGFIDTRPLIRRRTRHEFLHGPIDYGHFNKKGQETLAEACFGKKK